MDEKDQQQHSRDRAEGADESRMIRIEERIGFLEHELESLAESVRGLIARCESIERATSTVYSRLAERVDSLEESVPDDDDDR